MQVNPILLLFSKLYRNSVSELTKFVKNEHNANPLKTAKHLDIYKVYNTLEWNYILVVDVKINNTIERKLFNLSYNGTQLDIEDYNNMNDNSFEFYKNLGEEMVKPENDIR